MILKTEKEILRKLVIFKNSLGDGLFNPPSSLVVTMFELLARFG